MIDLSIIIVSYNTETFLRKCLSALQKVLAADKKTSYEIIVVDNASSDTSVAMVKKEFPEVLLIENRENTGFSKANNIGVKKAKGEFLLFLNSDAIISDQPAAHPLNYLISFMRENLKAGAVTCMVTLPNGEIDDACHRGYPTPWNALCHFSGIAKLFPKSTIFNGYHMGYQQLEETHEIDALAGAFMLVRRTAGEQCRWWDEEYFFYGEDLDFCYMLKQNGWKIYFIPHVQVVHYKGVSSGIKEVSQHVTRATSDEKIRITKARFDAMKIFYRKHYINTYPKFITSAVMKGIDLKMQMTLKQLQ